MAALALVDVLPDFGAIGQKPAAPFSAADAAELEAAALAVEPPAPSIEQMVQHAVEHAEALLREQLAAEHEAALEMQRAAHAAEIAALEARMGEELGKIIASRLDEVEERLTELATSATARILALHASADVQKRMAAALAETIRAALRDKEAVRVRVSGPLSLYESVRQVLGEDARRLEYSETDSLDLSVSIDEAILETRLSEWAAALAEALS